MLYNHRHILCYHYRCSFTLCLRMVLSKLHTWLFLSGKRIHMGAYEAMFFPMLIYSFFMDKRLKDDYPCVTSALLSGTLLGTFLIPIIFYTYSGILGRNYIQLDIAVFIISVILAFLAVYRLTLSCKTDSYTLQLCVSISVLLVCFLVFPSLPPNMRMFIVRT